MTIFFSFLRCGLPAADVIFAISLGMIKRIIMEHTAYVQTKHTMKLLMKLNTPANTNQPDAILLFLRVFQLVDVVDDELDGSRPDDKIQSSRFPTDGAN
jgi:hypothetical protein